MSAEVVLLAGAVGVGLALSLWRALRRSIDKEDLRGSWGRMARRRGWVVSGDGLVLEASADDLVDVRVRIEADTSAEGAFIRFSTDSQAPPGFSFRIYRKGARTQTRWRLVPLGPPLAGAFTVESSDEELVRAWLHRALRGRLRVVLRNDLDFALELSERRVTTTIQRLEWPAEVLAELVALTAHAATGDRELLAVWRRLCDELDGTSDPSSVFPPPPITIVRAGCMAQLALVREKSGWVTRVSARALVATKADERAVQTELPGMVLDGARLAAAVEEAIRSVGVGAPAPYR